MKILILTGGDLDPVFACSYIKTWKPDRVIAADKGLLQAEKLDLQPDAILGDFDSCSREVIKRFETKDKTLAPCEKDDTDTGLAVQKALSMGADEILILGATGTRLDHVLGNIGQLVYAFQNGAKAQIVDGHNRISVLEHHHRIAKEQQFGQYISLIPLYEAKGVTLSGFKYPLNEDTLVFHESWGISNELIETYGEIRFRSGTLLMIESRD